MIENCPYRQKCNGVDCDKDFCMRKYRLYCLYDNSLLTDKQQITNRYNDIIKYNLFSF